MTTLRRQDVNEDDDASHAKRHAPSIPRPIPTFSFTPSLPTPFPVSRPFASSLRAVQRGQRRNSGTTNKDDQIACAERSVPLSPASGLSLSLSSSSSLFTSSTTTTTTKQPSKVPSSSRRRHHHLAGSHCTAVCTAFDAPPHLVPRSLVRSAIGVIVSLPSLLVLPTDVFLVSLPLLPTVATRR